MSQAWLIVSGKGGVGKSMVTSSLSLALARRGMTCSCVDADMGLRSLDMLFNMHNKVVYDALDVARKDCKVKYALIPHTQTENLTLLPASQLGDVSDMSAADMARIVKKIKKRAGYVFLDAPAGIGKGVKNLLPSIDHSILVTTADDVAIRDAERVIAMLEEAGKERPLLIVNRVIPEMVASGEMYSPQTVAATLDVPLLGYVPDDRAVIAAINRHESFMDHESDAQQAMERIAQRFLGEYIPMPSFPAKKRSWFFWRRKQENLTV